jgi:hypothetical protein
VQGRGHGHPLGVALVLVSHPLDRRIHETCKVPIK